MGKLKELTVELERTVNLGNYENVRIRTGLIIQVSDTDDVKELHKKSVNTIEKLNKEAIQQHYDRVI